MKYKVQNDKGLQFEVDITNLGKAVDDGFLPVMSDGNKSYPVRIENLGKAFDAGYRPLSSEPKDQMSMLERYVRGGTATLPVVGGIAGGLIGIGTPATPIGGAMLGAGTGKALENTINQALFEDEISPSQQAYDITKEMALEGLGEGVGRVVGKGFRYIKEDVAKPIFDQFKRSPKMNEKEILEAGQRLGIKKVPEGVRTESGVRQNLESYLAQSPKPAGREIESQYIDLYNRAQQGAETVLRPSGQSVTPIMAGQEAKGLMKESVESQLKPAIKTYEGISGLAKNIGFRKNSINAVSRNIRNLDYAIPGTPEGAFANNIANSLESLTEKGSLTQLKRLKSYVGQIAGDSGQSNTMRYTAGQIGKKLQRLEQSSITRSAVESGGEEQGKKIAKGIISEIKSANKIYKKVSNNLKELSSGLGLKKIRNYQDFINQISDMPEETLMRKFFNTNNYKYLSKFKEEFPKAFDQLKQAKLSEMYKQMDLGKNFSFASFNRGLNKLSPEVKKLMFSKDQLQMIDDITLIYKNVPDNINPSGTAKTIEMADFSFVKPETYFQTWQQNIKKWILENPEKASRLGRKVDITNFLKNAKLGKYKIGARVIDDSFNRDEKPKNKEMQFVQRGFDKVLLLGNNKDLENLDLDDRTTRRLLKEASSQPTNSKMFQNTIKKLEQRLGK